MKIDDIIKNIPPVQFSVVDSINDITCKIYLAKDREPGYEKTIYNEYIVKATKIGSLVLDDESEQEE